MSLQLLQHVVDECMRRLELASPSPVERELKARAEQVRVALRTSTANGDEQRITATGELVLKFAEEVLGRIDPNVEDVRRWLRAAKAGGVVAPEEAPARKVCPRCRSLQRASSRHCTQCQADLFGVEPSLVIDQRYALMQEIGRGAMGVVYLAHDTGLNRSIALKLLGEDKDRDSATRFRREAAAVAQVRSDHVVQVYAFGIHGRSHFLAMEHVEGSSLEEILVAHARAHERIPVARAVTILSQVARGVAAVHAAKVVHRDVKPANIVVEERSGRPVLIDFGLAMRVTDSLRDDAAAGTPHYMAPEQIMATTAEDYAKLSPQTDIYALGCVAFELLCGRTPFEAATVTAILQMHLRAPPPAPSAVRPGVADFDAVVQRAMGKDPAGRYEDGVAFALAMEEAYRRFASPGPTLPPPPPSSQPEQVMTSRPERGPLRVLIVDDDDMVRKVCARCAQAAFGDGGAEIVVASSGAEALASAAPMPDVVLLDYAMPHLDGLETLSRLRAMPHGNHARVILISASSSELPRWKFTVLGVNDFVAKPLRITPFIELLRDIARDGGWKTSVVA